MDLESFVRRFSSPKSPVATSVIISNVRKCAQSIDMYTISAYRGESYSVQFMLRCELAIRYARMYKSIESEPYELEKISLNMKNLIFETVCSGDRIAIIKNTRAICVLVEIHYLRDGNTDEIFLTALKIEGKL